MILLRDISPAHQDDIEALGYPKNQGQIDVLVAVAAQLEMWEGKDMCDALNWERYQAVLQVWEAVYEAAGGVPRYLTPSATTKEKAA